MLPITTLLLFEWLVLLCVVVHCNADINILNTNNPTRATTISTRAWRSHGSHYQFPEINSGILSQKSPIAAAFSGGGARAFACALGQMRALHDLQTLQRMKYLTGVSGGSWATAAYTYAQPETFGNDDRVLLGENLAPQNITMAALKEIDSRCARKSVTKSLVTAVGKHILFGSTPAHAWVQALGENFLEPHGISKDSYFTWDNASYADIMDRNPTYARSKFVMPPHDLGRPFPILEITMLTPKFAVPLPYPFVNFTNCEVTPLYTGNPRVSNITYKLSPNAELLVGGFVEPHAVGSAAPAAGLGEASTGTLQVPKPAQPFTLATAIGESSWFPGAFLATFHLLDLLGDTISYWSPAAAADPFMSEMYVGDGGDLENIGIISTIRRAGQGEVARIYAFDNPNMALNLSWDPTERRPTATDIGDSLPSYFGVFIDEIQRGFDYRMNQIFNNSDFIGVVQQLMVAARAGTGAVATTLLTTIDNPHWGISAGITVNITWIHLTRCFKWEEQLPPDMQKLIVPTKDPNNTASLITSGPFYNFPHYPTGSTELSAEAVNLVASLTGWVVQQHPETFT